MAKQDDFFFESMCIFTYEHNNNIFTTIVYLKNPNYNIIHFHNSCILIAKINNCLSLNIVNNNERIIVELSKIIPTIEVSVSVVRQIHDAISNQLTSITI